MQISVFYDHILKAAEATACSMPDILQQFRSFGLNGVYINLKTMANDFDGTMQLLNNTGLSVCGMYETFHWENGFSEIEAQAFVDMAVRCKTDNILIVPGFLTKDEANLLRKAGSPDEIAAFMESNVSIRSIRCALQFTVDYAKSQGISVSLEDYDGWTAPYSRLAELKWWMTAIPGLRFTLDTGNFAFSDEDVLNACYELRDHIVHVHCKDRGEDPSISFGKYNRGLLPCAVGDGYLPISKAVAHLKETGYTSGLTIEHFSVSDYKSSILRSVTFLSSLA